MVFNELKPSTFVVSTDRNVETQKLQSSNDSSMAATRSVPPLFRRIGTNKSFSLHESLSTVRSIIHLFGPNSRTLSAVEIPSLYS